MAVIPKPRYSPAKTLSCCADRISFSAEYDDSPTTACALCLTTSMGTRTVQAANSPIDPDIRYVSARAFSSVSNEPIRGRRKLLQLSYTTKKTAPECQSYGQVISVPIGELPVTIAPTPL